MALKSGAVYWYSGHAGPLIQQSIYFLHQSLYLRKASSEPSLLSFHLLPLNIFAPGLHRTCCFSVCWCSPKLTVWLEVWWPASHPLVFLSGLIPHLGKVFLNINLSGLWAWICKCLQHGGGEWQLGVGASSGCVLSAFQHALLVAKARSLMDWGDLNLTLATVLVEWKSSTSLMEFSVKKLEQKKV